MNHAPHLSISKIGPDSNVLLRNLFEHYIHDMAEFFDIDTGADGSYSYDTSAIWTRGDEVYLAKSSDSIAEFALVGSAVEWLGDSSTYDMREFFVIRRFRRSGFGRTIATYVWNQHPGEWLVRVVERNVAAVLFWRTAISRQSPGSYVEEGRMVNGRPWRFFRFTSKGR
jgi:predicted acetyltransferase